MRNFKKIISLVLVATIILTTVVVNCFVFAGAKDSFESDEIVGTLTLTCTAHHSILVFHNTSGKSIDISDHINNFYVIYDYPDSADGKGEFIKDLSGNYSEDGVKNPKKVEYVIPNKEIITLSSSTASILDTLKNGAGGSCLNIETLDITAFYKNVSVTKPVKYEGLINAIDYFNENNTFDMKNNNCTHHAADAWKAVYGVDLSVGSDLSTIEKHKAFDKFVQFDIESMNLTDEILKGVDASPLELFFYKTLIKCITYFSIVLERIAGIFMFNKVTAYPSVLQESIKSTYIEDYAEYYGFSEYFDGLGVENPNRFLDVLY